MLRNLVILLWLMVAATSAYSQALTNHAVPVGRGAGVAGFNTVGPCTANQTIYWTGNTADPSCQNLVIGAAGSVQYSTATGPGSDPTNFFYDSTNHRLGLGTNAPSKTLDITGTLGVSGAVAFAGTLTAAAITGLPNPTNASDAANKAYVDSLATGLSIKTAVRLASAAVLPQTPTYANGASGVGATLSAAAASNTALVVDGVTVSSSDRILVKNQASQLQNGVYTVTTVGGGGMDWVLTRATDFDTAAKMLAGSYFLVTTGSTNSGSAWTLTATVTTVGTTAAVFTQFSSQTTVSNSDGSLTVSPISGAVVASLNVAHANIFTATQTIIRNGLNLALDTPSGSQQAATILKGNGTTYWLTGKDTDNSYFVYDNVRGGYPLQIASNGNMNLMPGGGTLTSSGDTFFKSGRPWCDIKAYGAVGTGSPSDAATNDAAIASCLGVVGPAGGIIYVPPGTFYISTTIDFTPYKNAYVELAGANGTALITATNIGIVYLNGQSHYVHDIQLFGYNSSSASTSTLKVGVNCLKCQVSNVYTSGGGSGWEILGEVAIYDSSVIYAYRDYVYTAGGTYITRGRIDTGNPPITAASFTGTGSGTNLTASVVSGKIQTGAVITGAGVPANTTIVSQSSGTPGGAGVYVTSVATTSSGASITTNACSFPGVVTTTLTQWTSSTSYTRCKIAIIGTNPNAWVLMAANNGTSGGMEPSVPADYGSYVVDNTVTWGLLGPAGSYSSGIHVVNAPNVYVWGTDITGPFYNGVYIEGNSSNIAFTDNTIEMALYSTFYIHGGWNIALKGNTIGVVAGIGGAALLIDSPTVGDVMVDSNSIINANTAIALGGGPANVLISNNTIVGITYGFDSSNGAGGFTLMGNGFKSAEFGEASSASIRIGTGSDDFVIVGNRCGAAGLSNSSIGAGHVYVPGGGNPRC